MFFLDTLTALCIFDETEPKWTKKKEEARAGKAEYITAVCCTVLSMSPFEKDFCGLLYLEIEFGNHTFFVWIQSSALCRLYSG